MSQASEAAAEAKTDGSAGRRTVDSWPDLGLGLAITAFGFVEAAERFDTAEGVSPYLVAAALGLAAGLHRRAPGFALLLVWLGCGVQVLTSFDVMLVELAVTVVAYGAARYGRVGVVWASGLSMPAAALVGVLFVATHGAAVFDSIGLQRLAVDSLGTRLVALVLGASAPLVVPWLLGLVLRAVDQSRSNRAAAVQADERRAEAEEVARLRQRQADLARDVHDVVGHSLAVILAQAESAQYRDGADTEALQRTLTTIATSARASLQDVRQVLSATGEPAAAPPGGLDQLVSGVRSGGHEVLSSEIGTPRPLPPELDHVSYRVLQEMLTNALRHGRRGVPLRVERCWGEHDLRLEVRNAVHDDGPAEHDPIHGPGPDGQGPDGQGLDGMRRRLESVGGRLAVRRGTDDAGPTFVTTAWVPLRPGRPVGGV